MTLKINFAANSIPWSGNLMSG